MHQALAVAPAMSSPVANWLPRSLRKAMPEGEVHLFDIAMLAASAKLPPCCIIHAPAWQLPNYHWTHAATATASAAAITFPGSAFLKALPGDAQPRALERFLTRCGSALGSSSQAWSEQPWLCLYAPRCISPHGHGAGPADKS